jgi:hypothetical protein
MGRLGFVPRNPEDVFKLGFVSNGVTFAVSDSKPHGL